ncbi:MAG: thioredoxin [Clostridiales bacterium]|nr:thioredoxin [Clostridiales bacterium]
MAVRQTTAEAFQQDVLSKASTVVVDFYADWCGPCKMIAPTLEGLAEELPQVEFFKLNVDNAQDICMKYGVMSIPTLIVFRGGEEVQRSVGLQGKEALKRMIEG